MTRLATAHVGQIQLGRETMKTIIRGNRQRVISELNYWLFDYLYANSLPIQQLPPLDDWTRSHEDSSFWSIKFPDDQWVVSIWNEYIEVK